MSLCKIKIFVTLAILVLFFGIINQGNTTHISQVIATSTPNDYIVTQYWTWYTENNNPHWTHAQEVGGEPILGYYSSHNPNVAAQHISQMLGNSINALSVGFMMQAGDGTFWCGLDPDQAFQDGVMQAQNFEDIDFSISYDICTRAWLVHLAEKQELDVVPGVEFIDPYITAQGDTIPPSYDFSLQDSNGKYIYDELLLYDFKYMAENYFNESNYLKINNQAVVFIYDSWRFNNGGQGGPADGFGRAFNRLRTEIFNEYGIKLYLVGDFMKYTTADQDKEYWFRDWGFYQHYDAVNSWNIVDGNYFSQWPLSSLSQYTNIAGQIHNQFRPAVQSATRGYRYWLPSNVKAAYGSENAAVDFIPLLSYSFGALLGDENEENDMGFWSDQTDLSQLIAQAQMVKSQRDNSPLAEDSSTMVYHVAFNQWSELQVIEAAVEDNNEPFPAKYGWRYLGVTHGILGEGW